MTRNPSDTFARYRSEHRAASHLLFARWYREISRDYEGRGERLLVPTHWTPTLQR